jgi:hypothetical protein
MFYKLWFLYLPKIIFPTFALVVALAAFGHMSLAIRIGGWILIPLGLIGAGLALFLLFIRPTLACPFCNTQSPLTSEQNRVGLSCPNCGHMHINGPLAFSITRDPDDDANNDDEVDEDDDDEQ